MCPTRQNAAARRRLRGGWAVPVLALLLFAAPAWSAKVTEVRVGRHPEFTRVVFQLDQSAGYRIERKMGANGPELFVTLDAAAQARTIPFRTRGISKVVVDSGAPSATAHIVLREEGIRVKEMILANPPRIVLDVMRANTVAVARKPAPDADQQAAAEKAKAEKLAAEQAAAEKARAEKLAAEQAAAEKAKAEKLAAEQAAAEKARAEKLAAEQAAAEKARAEKLAAEQAAAEKARAEKLAAEQAAAEKAKAEKLAAAGQADAQARAESPAGTDIVARAEPGEAAARAAAKPRPDEPGVAKPKVVQKPAAKPARPTPATSSESWFTNPVILGAGAGVLLCLVGFVLLMRRRRPLPNDLDVMAIAESGAGEGDGQSLSDQLAGDAGDVLGDSPSGTPLDGLFDDESDQDSAAASQVPPSRPTAPAPRAPSTPATQGAADDSLFDTDADPNAATTMGDQSMNQGTSDLPADPDRVGAPPASPAGARSSAAPDSDVLRVVHELERRMAQLESKLQESNEARERLERQVAAQSEELRVQRAAIARTQRALRTMSRGDEDKATEPALRDGDTQTKTRVSE
jgi:hypothetical protein